MEEDAATGFLGKHPATHYRPPSLVSGFIDLSLFFGETAGVKRVNYLKTRPNLLLVLTWLHVLGMGTV
jgi:hypothetical protein